MFLSFGGGEGSFWWGRGVVLGVFITRFLMF